MATNNPENGPFADFLKELEASGKLDGIVGPHEPAPNKLPDYLKSPEPDDSGKIQTELVQSLARFSLTVTTDSTDAAATLIYPSRVYRVEPDEMHEFVDDLFTTAYPQARPTPKVALINNGLEQRFDLENWWQAERYKKALGDGSVDSLVYYANIGTIPVMPAFSFTSGRPDFMYGVFSSGRERKEFITMSHLKARTVGPELVRLFLPRNTGYLGGVLEMDSQQLAGKIRDVANANPVRHLS